MHFSSSCISDSFLDFHPLVFSFRFSSSCISDSQLDFRFSSTCILLSIFIELYFHLYFHPLVFSFRFLLSRRGPKVGGSVVESRAHGSHAYVVYTCDCAPCPGGTLPNNYYDDHKTL